VSVCAPDDFASEAPEYDGATETLSIESTVFERVILGQT